MKRYNCLDGEMDGLIEFDAALAISPVKDNPIDRDNFYPADGEEITFSNARGIFKGTSLDRKERAKRRAKREKRKDIRQQRRTARTLSKADARKSQGEALRLASKESKADVEMAKALRAPVETKKGLSMTAKVGIGLGVVAVLGLGAYFLLKKKK